MPRTMQEVHDMGRHARYPRPKCPLCQDEADLAEGFARQSELERLNEEMLDSQEAERDNLDPPYDWSGGLAYLD